MQFSDFRKARDILEKEGIRPLLSKTARAKFLSPAQTTLRRIAYRRAIPTPLDDWILSKSRLRQYCEERGAVWTFAHDEAESIPMVSDGHVPERIADTIDRSPRWFCELSDATLVGNRGIVRTVDGYFVQESQKDFDLRRALRECWPQLYRDRLYRAGFPRMQSLEPMRFDTAMSMVMHTGVNNAYGHWLTEYLPMLRHLEEYEERTGYEPTLIVNNDPAEWMLESLEILGYPAQRRVEWDDGLAKVRRLLFPVTSMTGGRIEHIRYSPVEYRWLRRRLLEEVRGTAKSGNDRIYVSRQGVGSRRVVNFEEIKSVLTARGFRILRPEEVGFREQVRLFSNAELVVGPHGSGLHNMFFAHDIGVIELLPPEWPPACNHSLAVALGHRYDSVTGESAGPQPRAWKKNVSFRIDPAKLETAIQQLTPSQTER